MLRLCLFLLLLNVVAFDRLHQSEQFYPFSSQSVKHKVSMHNNINLKHSFLLILSKMRLKPDLVLINPFMPSVVPRRHLEGYNCRQRTNCDVINSYINRLFWQANNSGETVFHTCVHFELSLLVQCAGNLNQVGLFEIQGCRQNFQQTGITSSQASLGESIIKEF